MNKADLTRRLARRSRSTRAEAADQLDRVVNRILSRLKNGESARLPGLGTFTPGASWRFEFNRGFLQRGHARGDDAKGR